MKDTIYYRRNLPHIHPRDGIFFITFRLAGTLPVAIVNQLREEQNLALKSLDRKIPPKQLQKRKRDLDKRYFIKFDDLLNDAATGPRWLADDRIAALVAEKIHALDDSQYKLIAYDHYVRDNDELIRIVEYILNNPVKAGLVEDAREWKYSYCNTDLIT